jgi:hypothetical protein
MKKFIKLLSISALVFSLSAHAQTISMQVLGRCNSSLYTVPNQNVALSTTDEAPGKISRIEYKTTDANGYVYLDQKYHGKMIKIYLAGDRSVNVDCGSRLMPVESGVVILGENGSLCPSFCPHSH